MNYRNCICILALITTCASACSGEDIYVGVTSSGSAADEVGESGTGTSQESGGMEQGSDTAGTDTAGTDTSATDTSATDTSATDTGATDTGATDTSATDTGATDTGTDTGMSVCDPQLLDIPCLACIKDACCPQIDACLGDAACSCAYDCVTMGGDPQQCQIDCNAINTVTNTLLLCGQLNCAATCVP